jgi:signal transduction histidine kinase
LTIPPGKARFEFRYTGLSLTAPEKVRFKYKLDPLEEDWVEAGTRRTAIYSYLPPGHYRFRVLACNNDGVWNEAGAVLGLVLLPHFWQTWWFRGVAVAGLVLLFAGIYEFRLASERRLTRLRLRIARDLHDEVGSNLGSIALLSQVAPRAPALAKEEMSEIRRVAVQTIDSLRDIVWFLDPANDSMADLVLRMKEGARTMLAGITFQFDSRGENETGKPSLELRRNLFPMFKEILHNIIKHAQASHVQIELENSLRAFRLRVKDNGVGFDEKNVRLGNGLKNLRRRAADLGGSIEIDSRRGQGTTVIVQAPIT